MDLKALAVHAALKDPKDPVVNVAHKALVVHAANEAPAANAVRKALVVHAVIAAHVVLVVNAVLQAPAVNVDQEDHVVNAVLLDSAALWAVQALLVLPVLKALKVDLVLPELLVSKV